MIIDGKKIAEEIKNSLKKEIAILGKEMRLDVIQVGENEVSEKFINIKKKIGEEIGVKVLVHRFSDVVSEEDLLQTIREISLREETSGVIIQLPLPKNFNTQKVLDSVPVEKDVDFLSSQAKEKFKSVKSKILPPVVGAVRDILENKKISLENKKIIVIGKGKLVGEPVSNWLKNLNAEVEAVDAETKNIFEIIKNADIIISGAGAPGLIKPEMIKNGVVIIDASTSELHGKLAGDADPLCAEKCSVFTPVPGGVGPITVVELFKNLMVLNFE